MKFRYNELLFNDKTFKNSWGPTVALTGVQISSEAAQYRSKTITRRKCNGNHSVP